MHNNWVMLYWWILFSFLISIILFGVFYFLISKPIDYEKVSAYECGFNPFEEVYGRFDIRYYLVAILFIIFDLEVIFLYPWTTVFGFIYLFGFWIVLFFILLLFVGFLYEWKRGALDW